MCRHEHALLGRNGLNLRLDPGIEFHEFAVKRETSRAKRVDTLRAQGDKRFAEALIENLNLRRIMPNVWIDAPSRVVVMRVIMRVNASGARTRRLREPIRDDQKCAARCSRRVQFRERPIKAESKLHDKISGCDLLCVGWSRFVVVWIATTRAEHDEREILPAEPANKIGGDGIRNDNFQGSGSRALHGRRAVQSRRSRCRRLTRERRGDAKE